MEKLDQCKQKGASTENS